MKLIKNMISPTTQGSPNHENDSPATENYKRIGNIPGGDRPPAERQAKISTFFDIAQLGLSLLPESLQGRRAFYRLGTGIEFRPIRFTQTGGVAFSLRGGTNFSSQHTAHLGANGEFNVGDTGMYRLFGGVTGGIQVDRISEATYVRPSIRGEFGATMNLTHLFRVSPFLAAQAVLPKANDPAAERMELNLLIGLRIGLYFLRTAEPTIKEP